MKKFLRPRHIILILLCALILLVRFIPHGGETYARYVYPYLSMVLSWISSFVFFSLDEWIVVVGVFCMIMYPLYARSKHKKALAILGVEVEAMIWVTVWFYLGWGLNYHRDSFYERLQVSPKSVDKSDFISFLNTYTDSLNATYVVVDSLDKNHIYTEIKRLYSMLPEEYGLTKPQDFQKPKALAFNSLYSSVLVKGYMGPFANESHLNEQLFNDEYAFIYAHELAHLLSVSNEAESNYWAYTVCTKSEDRVIRYSGYYGIFPNVVRNAQSILSENEYDEWIKSVDPRVLESRTLENRYWLSHYSPLLNDIQGWMFNALLKGNGISDGIKNYDQVLSMIMSTI